MADDEASLGWFYRLSLNDQVAILSDRHAGLPPQLVQDLTARPVAPTWVTPESPTHWVVERHVADALDARRKQLDNEEGVSTVRFTTDHKRLLGAGLPAHGLMTEVVRLFTERAG